MILLYISQAWHQWITSSTVTQKETDLLYRCKNTFSHKVATESQDWLLQPQEVLPTQVSCPSQPTSLANAAQQSANYFLGGWMQPDHMNYLQVPQCTGHPGQCRSPNTLFFGLSTTSSSNWSYPCTWVSSIPCSWTEIREQHSQLYLWRCKTLKYTPADINVCRWVITPYSNHRGPPPQGRIRTISPQPLKAFTSGTLHFGSKQPTFSTFPSIHWHHTKQWQPHWLLQTTSIYLLFRCCVKPHLSRNLKFPQSGTSNSTPRSYFSTDLRDILGASIPTQPSRTPCSHALPQSQQQCFYPSLNGNWTGLRATSSPLNWEPADFNTTSQIVPRTLHF